MKDLSNKCIKTPADRFGTVSDSKQMIVRRVPTEEASNHVQNGPWEYATKDEWRADGRKWGVTA